jgi:GrpB-like predicted nucleotidyltransferase (UPF0157 family)
MTVPITIEDYDPRWPEQFEVLRLRLVAKLDGIAARIEHVGSTAVPGLAAKPIIDIDVFLHSDADLPAAITKLAFLGYEHRGDLGVRGRHAFRAPPGEPPHHLYVCLPTSSECRRHILFRDVLRQHPEYAHAYADLKRKLAQKFCADREAYTLAKAEFVRELLTHTDHRETKNK